MAVNQVIFSDMSGQFNQAKEIKRRLRVKKKKPGVFIEAEQGQSSEQHPIEGMLQSGQSSVPGIVVVVVDNELLSLDIIRYIIITTIHMSESLFRSVSVCIDEPRVPNMDP